MSNYMGCGSQLDKDNLKEKLLELEKTGKYCVEEKLDGQWAEIHVVGGRVVKILSRTGKEKSFEELLKYRFPRYITGIFIGEIGYGSTNSKLKENLAVIYDLVKYIRTNESVCLAENFYNIYRHLMLRDLLINLNPGVSLVKRRQRGFLEFYNEVLKNGGEGIIIKKLHGADTLYQKGTRSQNWIKVKKGVEVDMVVMGVIWREPEKMSKLTKSRGADKFIKAIICGQYYNGKLREEVHVGSMPDYARKWFSQCSSYRQIVSIKGFEQFQKTGAIRHCSLVINDNGEFIREDLAPSDCVFGKIKII